MRSRLVAAVGLTFVIALGACKKENENNGVVLTNNTPNNGTPDTGSQDTGGGTPDMGSPNNGAVDLGTNEDVGIDFNVAAPGFMHGTWEVQNRADNAKIATLRLRHVEGMTTVTGTYSMDEPASTGPIGGAQYVNNSTFIASWTIDVEGSNETLGLSDCTASDDNTMECRHNSTLTGNVTDALLVRQ